MTLLVVGGGLGGAIAALTAAEEGADVRLLRVAEDRFDYHPGTVDVLGYLPESDASGARDPVAKPLEMLDRLPETHPYRRFGPGPLREGLARFDDAVSYGNRGGNGLVPTAAGRLHPTARWPPSMAPGLAGRQEPMALVGFLELPELDASVAANLLDQRLPYNVSDRSVSLPGTLTEYPAAPTLAAAFDADEPPSGEVGLPEAGGQQLPPELRGEAPEGTSLRGELVESLRPELDVEPRLGLPAVLGERDTASIRAELASGLGARVFEVPIGPPSVPGRRLRRRPDGALEAAGVAVDSGDVTGFRTDSGRLSEVRIDGEPLDVSAVVLATGDLSGPGLVAVGSAVTEPRFDCPVTHPPERADWTAPFDEPQPLARVGLSVDDDLRPVGDDGDAVYENLHAVGRLLAGTDYERERSAGGVAVATAVAAVHAAR